MTDAQRYADDLLSSAAELEADAAKLREVKRMDGTAAVVINGVHLCVLDLRAVAERWEKLAADLRNIAAVTLARAARP